MKKTPEKNERRRKRCRTRLLQSWPHAQITEKGEREDRVAASRPLHCSPAPFPPVLTPPPASCALKPRLPFSSILCAAHLGDTARLRLKKKKKKNKKEHTEEAKNVAALWETDVDGSPEIRSSRPAWPTWQNPVSTKNTKISQVWWHTPVTQLLGRLRQENCLTRDVEVAVSRDSAIALQPGQQE
ncbi:putative uncharacterized protein C8orf44 [Plecturocebus cupreus]